MSTRVPTLTFADTRPDWVQVYEKLKKCLTACTWPAGTKLPSTKKLAITWQTHDVTVHKAMQQLVKEGYLERRQPIGTFVRERPTTPRTIGLYYTEGSLAAPEHRFLRAIHQALIDRRECVPHSLEQGSRRATEPLESPARVPITGRAGYRSYY